jgi:zinc/manganese transport system ATP-binding protein
MSEVIIRLENVSTVYEGERRAAIKDIDLAIRRGEFVYVVGPNGAGKTTLLETINGLLVPIKGIVRVFGQDMKKNGRKIRCRIGYVPQDFIVEPGEPYTALDVVLMGMYGKIGVLRKPDSEDLEKALKAMKLLNIDELAERTIGKLSGGQQQKVMIARAIAKDPEILLLDEPFSNLDVDSRLKIPELIGQLHLNFGMTTILVTHDTSRILKLCNRIVVMNDGRIVADGKPAKILSAIQTPIVEGSYDVA